MNHSHRFARVWLSIALVAGWCASGAAAAAQAMHASCPQSDSGLKLPPGFCATIFADGIGNPSNIALPCPPWGAQSSPPNRYRR